MDGASVILCAWRNIMAETAECMMQLQTEGWGYMIKRGDALISRSRSIAVSHWYTTTQDDVFLMIDDDVVFETRGARMAVEMAREKRSIVCGAYPVKDGTHFALRRQPGQEILFGENTPPVEIIYPATGFMAVHRDVIDAMVAAKNGDGSPRFPLCDVGGLSPMWPMFDCFVLTGEDGRSEYLSEDYAFGEVARQLGFTSWLDTRINLFHLGLYPYCVQNMTTARQVEVAPGTDAVQTTDGFRMIVPRSDDVIGKDLRVLGEWSGTTGEALKNAIQPGDLLLDLGAHWGYFSVMAAKAGAHVIAVEPVPANAELLRKNIKLNGVGGAVEVHECAVVPDGVARVRMTSNPSNSGGAYRVGDGGMVVAARELSGVTNGRWPDVVKIDIEGDEYRVLEANPELLERARVVICEASEEQLRRNSGAGVADLVALFERYGFACRTVNPHQRYHDIVAEKVRVLA